MGHSFLYSMIENDLTWDLIFYVIWTSFVISLFIYDWDVIRRFHPITYIGLLIFSVI